MTLFSNAARVAQWIRRPPPKRKIGGSSPPVGNLPFERLCWNDTFCHFPTVILSDLHCSKELLAFAAIRYANHRSPFRFSTLYTSLLVPSFGRNYIRIRYEFRNCETQPRNQSAIWTHTTRVLRFKLPHDLPPLHTAANNKALSSWHRARSDVAQPRSSLGHCHYVW